MHFIGGWLDDKQVAPWLSSLVAKYHCLHQLDYPGPWRIQEYPSAAVLSNGAIDFKLAANLHFNICQSNEKPSSPLSGLAKIERWSLLDNTGKKRLDLFLFFVESHPSEPYLLPCPLRGYAKAFRQFNKQLLTHPGITLAGYNSLIHGFHKGEKADEKPDSIDTCLWNLINDIDVRKSTLGEIDDIELLHQFRVSVRRARSWLKQHPGAFTGLSKRLKQLIKATNHSRDLDVFMTESQQLIDWVKPRYQPALTEVFGLLAEQNQQQQKRIFKNIQQSPSLLASLEESADNKSKPLSETTTRQPQTLEHLIAEALNLIDLLYEDADDEAFHHCRICLKQVRYILEFDSATMRSIKLLKQLKPIQDVLGEFNDRCMQQQELLSQCRLLSLSKPQTKAIKAMVTALHNHTQQQKPILVNALRTLKPELLKLKKLET